MGRSVTAILAAERATAHALAVDTLPRAAARLPGRTPVPITGTVTLPIR